MRTIREQSSLAAAIFLFSQADAIGPETGTDRQGNRNRAVAGPLMDRTEGRCTKELIMANQDRTGGDTGRNQPSQGGQGMNHPGGGGSFNQGGSGSQGSDTMTRERGEREREREEERGQRSQRQGGGHSQGDGQGSRNR